MQVASCQSRGKTTREFLKKIDKSPKTSLTVKADRLFTFSRPNIHYDHVFTQSDIDKINAPMLSA